MAYELIKDLSFRLASKPQLTTDGLPWYAQAVEYAFGIDVDYATVEELRQRGGRLQERGHAV